MAQHKWHKEIKAWADGAIIECQNVTTGEWKELEAPYWYENNKHKYRIKPQPKEPEYLYVYKHEGNGISFGYKPHAGTNMWQTKVIGKIKLENDDDMQR